MPIACFKKDGEKFQTSKVFADADVVYAIEDTE